jgi:serine/threonine/tyrosine-interacting protein
MPMDDAQPAAPERTALAMATQFPKHSMNTPTEIHDWKYEMRREAQEILPRLYVGPYQSSRSFEALQALGITHIVCLSESRERNFVKPRFPDHFVYLPIELRDAQDQNLIRLFPTCV